jgi:hypothetical protein
MPRLWLTALLLPLFVACTTPYRQPTVEASDGVSMEFGGVMDLLDPARPLDILLVHGMCTHGKGWADAAVQDLYQSLGGDPTAVKLEPAEVLGSRIMLYQQRLQTMHGVLRVTAVVWSPVTTPLKRQLCYDQSQRSGYCTPQDAAKPYPYARALLNGKLKDTILDDCLSDAMIYQGRARTQINAQMQQAVLQATGTSALKSGSDATSLARAAAQEQAPMVVIADSLGSKLAFDAIYKLRQSAELTVKAAGNQTAARIEQVFLRANQVPILALADQQLGDAPSAQTAREFPEDSLGALMRLKPSRKMPHTGQLAAAVVAFSDPNDLLSYPLARSPHRKRQGYPVVDVITSNATTYLGLVELPNTAHTGYSTNRRVTRMIACGNWTTGKCRRE